MLRKLTVAHDHRPGGREGTPSTFLYFYLLSCKHATCISAKQHTMHLFYSSQHDTKAPRTTVGYPLVLLMCLSKPSALLPYRFPRRCRGSQRSPGPVPLLALPCLAGPQPPTSNQAAICAIQTPNRSRALAYCLRRSALISNGSPQTRRTKRTIHWAMCRDMGTVASTES